LKKRIFLKKLKKKAMKTLFDLDPTLNLEFITDIKDERPSFYRPAERVIGFNLYFEKKRIHEYKKKKVLLSLEDLMVFTITHEYGHSTRNTWSDWFDYYNTLYANYHDLPAFKQWEVFAKWYRYVLVEEKRAWNVARGFLMNYDQDVLETVIKDCLDSYSYLVELGETRKMEYKEEIVA